MRSLYKLRKRETDLNLILSKKYWDTRIAYRVRNRFAGGVNSVHSLWRQNAKGAIVYTNSYKDRPISFSLKKNIAIQLSHIVREIGVHVVWILYTVHGDKRREMRSLYKFRKRQAELDLILFQKYVAIQGSNIVWEISMQVVLILYTAHDDRMRKMRLSIQNHKRTDQSHPLQKNIATQ